MDVCLAVDFGSGKIAYDLWKVDKDPYSQIALKKTYHINRVFFKKQGSSYAFPPVIGVEGNYEENGFMLEDIHRIAALAYKAHHKEREKIVDNYRHILAEIFLHIKKECFNQNPKIDRYKTLILNVPLFIPLDFQRAIISAGNDAFGRTTVIVLMEDWIALYHHYWEIITKNLNKQVLLIDMGWNSAKLYLVQNNIEKKEIILIDFEEYQELSSQSIVQNIHNVISYYFQHMKLVIDFSTLPSSEQKAIYNKIRHLACNFLTDGKTKSYQHQTAHVEITDQVDQLFFKYILEHTKVTGLPFVEKLAVEIESFLNRNAITTSNTILLMSGALSRISHIEPSLKEHLVNIEIICNKPFDATLNGLRKFLNRIEQDSYIYKTPYGIGTYVSEQDSDFAVILEDDFFINDLSQKTKSRNYEVDFTKSESKDHIRIYFGILIGKRKGRYITHQFDFELDTKRKDINTTPLTITATCNKKDDSIEADLVFNFSELKIKVNKKISLPIKIRGRS